VLALAHHYDEPVTSGGVTYRARVYGAREADGQIGGWIVFFPLGGGRVVSTARETTQADLADLGYWAADLADLGYWASGLTHVYLEGALDRALDLQPDAVIGRELERLEALETSVELEAHTLEAAAAAARAESEVVKTARERTEDRFLATVADEAERDAVAHEIAAEDARAAAKAATGALRAKKQPAAKKKK
jgi:hypothetical protein